MKSWNHEGWNGHAEGYYRTYVRLCSESVGVAQGAEVSSMKVPVLAMTATAILCDCDCDCECICVVAKEYKHVPRRMENVFVWEKEFC